MYNLIEYISNYFETTGSLCFYSKDEATNFNAGIAIKIQKMNIDIFSIQILLEF